MALFHPVRTVTEPNGREWDLYVSRTALPSWQEGGYNSWVDDPDVSPATGLLLLPFALVGFICTSVIWPALRFLFLLPGAIVKGKRSHAMRIEAVSYYQEQETRLWTTTSDQVESVLSQIALGLEQGQLVKPFGSVYSGSRID